MREALKSFIRKVLRREKNGQPQQARSKQQRHTDAVAAASPRTKTRSSLPNSTAPTNHATVKDDSKQKDIHHHEKSRQFTQSPLERREGSNVTGTHSVLPGSVDPFVAENYEAYLPVISSIEPETNGPLHKDTGNFTTKATQVTDDVQSEDAVGDTSFDSTNLDLSLQTESDHVASSASSCYSDPTEDHTKESPMSTNRIKRKSIPSNVAMEETIPQETREKVDDPEDLAVKDVRDRQTNIPDGPIMSGDTTSFNGEHEKSMDDVRSQARSPIIDSNVRSHSHGVLGGQEQVSKHFNLADLDGIVNLKDSVDVEKSVEIAPAVQHEVVKPKEHEIVEERIFREIHNHEVYHRILPVHDVEILPARHFVHDPNGKLIEVSGDPFPHLAGVEKRWEINRKQQIASELTPHRPMQVGPKIIADKTYMTEEGYPRRETTILHPPELEDLKGYEGPVMPIVFDHHSPEAIEQTQSERVKSYESFPPIRSVWLEDMINALPQTASQSDRVSSTYTQAQSGAISWR
ncbi:unnamed protein product [Periconia digitata]|uniref:Uncharacterized protein n=1 Tax=Periconia digitata TaxID=1303443 RepID=A0A9W4U239_9PLEO|nr:unnamed protein product [Periconia digitata]